MKTCLIFIACALLFVSRLSADETLDSSAIIQSQALPIEINYSEKFYGPYDAPFGLEYLYHIEITDPTGFGDAYLTPMYEEIVFSGTRRSFDGTWEFPGHDSLCTDSLVIRAYEESLLLLLVSIQGEVSLWMGSNFPMGIDPYALADTSAYMRQAVFETRYGKITLSLSAFKKNARRIKARDSTRRSGL